MLKKCILDVIRRFGSDFEVAASQVPVELPMPKLALAVCGTNTTHETAANIIHAKAFIAPLKRKSLKYLSEIHIDPANIGSHSYIYIGPPHIRLDQAPQDTLVETGTGKYYLKGAHTVYLGSTPLYVIGTLQDYYEE